MLVKYLVDSLFILLTSFLTFQSVKSQDFQTATSPLGWDQGIQYLSSSTPEKADLLYELQRQRRPKKNLFLLAQAGAILLDHGDNTLLGPTVSLALRKRIDDKFHQFELNAFTKEDVELLKFGNQILDGRELKDRGFSIGYSYGRSLSGDVLSRFNGSLFLQIGYRKISEVPYTSRSFPITSNNYSGAIGVRPEFLVPISKNMGLLTTIDFPLFKFTQRFINVEDPVLLERDQKSNESQVKMIPKEASMKLGVFWKMN